MKIYRITNYLNNKEKFNNISNEIYELTKILNNLYPKYKEWFYHKQLKGCKNGDREILYILDKNKIVAVCNIKNDMEKKICTLFVDQLYRNNGLGSELLAKAMQYLKTSKPLCSFAEETHPYFRNIINIYNWQLTSIKDDLYIKGKKEYFYNETLK